MKFKIAPLCGVPFTLQHREHFQRGRKERKGAEKLAEEEGWAGKGKGRVKTDHAWLVRVIEHLAFKQRAGRDLCSRAAS